MFDSVGFFELVVIFGVALVVLGPKRLPGLVAKVGRWIGKARSMARQFTEQLENEVNLEELNRMTDVRTRESAKYPAPPPEFSGEPVPPAADGSAVPAPEPVPASADTSLRVDPAADDTYSHAHAAGEPPPPYVPEAADIPPAAAPEITTPETVTTREPHERA